MKGTAIFEIGKYACMVDYDVQPRATPEILNIEFEPDLYAEDINYKCDIIIPYGSTRRTQNIIMNYLEYCYIDDCNLQDLIEREL